MNGFWSSTTIRTSCSSCAEPRARRIRGRPAPVAAAKRSRRRRAPPDLMLLDVMMPEIDGSDGASALRSDPATPSIPVIVLTAKALAEDASRVSTSAQTTTSPSRSTSKSSSPGYGPSSGDPSRCGTSHRSPACRGTSGSPAKLEECIDTGDRLPSSTPTSTTSRRSTTTTDSCGATQSSSSRPRSARRGRQGERRDRFRRARRWRRLRGDRPAETWRQFCEEIVVASTTACSITTTLRRSAGLHRGDRPQGRAPCLPDLLLVDGRCARLNAECWPRSGRRPPSPRR